MSFLKKAIIEWVLVHEMGVGGKTKSKLIQFLQRVLK